MAKIINVSARGPAAAQSLLREARDLTYLVKTASHQLSEITSFDPRERIEAALQSTEGVGITIRLIIDKIQEAIEIMEEARRD